MTQLLIEPRSTGQSILHVDREDIAFFNVAPHRVRIEVTVHNTGDDWSEPTPMRIESAVLGAFVPWSPLCELTIPGIAPRHRTVVTTEVQHAWGVAFAGGAIPPQVLLTALATGDNDPRQRRPRARSEFERRLSSGTDNQRSLAMDLMSLINGTAPGHWAGNLNIFIGDRAVERHMAMALRIKSGQRNVAVFMIGSRPDAYRFELRGRRLSQHAALLSPTRHWNGFDEPGEHATQVIAQNEWIAFDRRSYLLLVVDAPRDCRAGNLGVHVTQQSSGRTAVVEFGFDAAAAGPGCYTA